VNKIPNRRKSIRAKCLDCFGGSYEVANQQAEVWDCPAMDCELWPYRKSKVERPSEIKS